MKNQSFKIILSLFILFLLEACTTFYEKNLQFQEYFVQGDFAEAEKALDKNKKAAKDKNRLLYYLQKGVLLHINKQYEESNNYFENAYLYIEDLRKNIGNEIAAVVSNPGVKPYKGEDHEIVLLHYYKVMNFLKLRKFEEALVECRRINIKLDALNDRYKKKKNRYQKDAFALNLMGIIYDASGDVNNAFIAYRNAFIAYDEIYKEHFSLNAPLQLKKDLLRTAHQNGFRDELALYESKFGFKYNPEQEHKGGELLFFWNNGLGPVKDEFSINFLIVKGQGGVVLFVNEELGLSFPFPLPPMGQGGNGLGDLKFVRVAFPKYLERKTFFRTAELQTNGQSYKVEIAEDINEIAFKTLNDRMLREFASSLMRLAIKQAAEQQVRKKNENLGTLLSVVNAISEKADTRNWQTLPYSIHYSRVPLKEGLNKFNFKTFSPHKSREKEHFFELEAKGNESIFHIHHNLESIPLDLR